MKEKLLTDDIMYEALINKDSQYEGLFFIAVKTTSIFCRPTCTAKKPKRENVEFFKTTQEALSNGYRPCRICTPMELKGDLPGYVKQIMSELKGSPHQRITDCMIRNMQIDPNKIRRWFKKNHGLTFQSYQRMLRINRAIGNIKFGDNVINAAFENGYDSLSGFQYSFRKTANFTPRMSPGKCIINITRITTPLGPMMAGATEEGVCLLEFTDRRMLENELRTIEIILKAPVLPGANKHFPLLEVQLKEYFEGRRTKFNLPVLLLGSGFQKMAWEALLQIPFGETRSYKQQAIITGNTKAVRAIGKANGDNRISIIIPCHRVIGEDGNLTGYGGGIWRKQWLLNHEKKYSGILKNTGFKE